MKHSFRLLLISFFIVTFCFSAAQADTVCLKSTIKDGKVKNSVRSVVEGKRCPRGFIPLVNATKFVQSSGVQGLQGPQGATGPQGPQGPQGPAGSVTTSNLSIITGNTDINSNSPKILYIECPIGTTLISCNGGIEEGFGLPTSKKIALSYSGINRIGDCVIRGFEPTEIADNWALFGAATCVPF